MRNLSQEFGVNVANRREKLGMSQQKLAEKAGLDRTTIGEIESGHSNVKLRTIERIAAALDIRPADLLMYDD